MTWWHWGEKSSGGTFGATWSSPKTSHGTRGLADVHGWLWGLARRYEISIDHDIHERWHGMRLIVWKDDLENLQHVSLCMQESVALCFSWSFASTCDNKKTTRYFNYDQSFDILTQFRCLVKAASMDRKAEKPMFLLIILINPCSSCWHLRPPWVFLKRTALGELTTLTVAMAGRSLSGKKHAENIYRENGDQGDHKQSNWLVVLFLYIYIQSYHCKKKRWWRWWWWWRRRRRRCWC